VKRQPGDKPETIDQYLAALSDDKRAALERLRPAALVRKLVQARIAQNAVKLG